MDNQYIMSLDQGTTSSRCIIYNSRGEIISKAQKEFEQIYPKAGWIEHNPMEIWSSQLSVATEAMHLAGLTYSDIAGIGITNQRETTVIWDKNTGKPIYNAIVWQCRRTSERIDRMKSDGMCDKVRQKTGLVPDAYFSASKIEWILDNVENARERAKNGELLFGTVDTWLVWNLTKGKVHITDYTNASRTMLFDIHNLCWDDELLEYFNIPAEILPKVCKSSCIYGSTHPHIFGGEIPIGSVVGDQQAALFGQCCFEEGEAKNTYGTGCFLLMNTGKTAIMSNNGLITTIAATIDEVTYALEGSVFVAGAAIQWLRDEMRMIKNASQTEEYAMSVKDAGDIYVVPAFTGLGAPYWEQYARGTVVGITRGCKKEHFIRAVLESIGYQVADVLKAMEEDSHIKLKVLNVDGGASANDFLMKFQSDILDTDVCRPEVIETTSLGAAYLAGLATGYWKNIQELKNNRRIGNVFCSDMDDATRCRLLKGWRKAVKCAMIWAEDE